MTPAILQIRPLDESHAVKILSWRYPPPYDLYNVIAPSPKAAIAYLLRPELNYVAVLDERDEMIAFQCFGEDAQVPGGNYFDEAVDLGGGLRPDLTGQGLGRHIVAASMNYALVRFQPRLFRSTVAGFNLRSKKLFQQLGYKVSSTFTRQSDKLDFEIMKQAAQMTALSIPMRA